MNKFGKQLVVTLAAGAAIALPVAVVSLQGSGRPSQAPLFTPVQLANGLAFNQGVAAPYLAAFERPEVPVTGKLLAVERSVDASLRANPSLARSFASDIQSGSAPRVAVALGVLGRLTRAAFGDEFGPAGDRRMTAWAKETPEDVTITAAVYNPPSTCATCVVNTPPATVPGPTPPPPPFTPFPICTGCITYTPPPTVTAPAPPPPTITYPPPTCSTCVVNTPPATIPAPTNGAPQVERAASVPSGVALSLPYLMAEPHRTAPADRKNLAETIAVVAFSLNAD